MLFHRKVKYIKINIKTICSKNKKNLTIIYERSLFILHDTVLMLNLVFFQKFSFKKPRENIISSF